MAFIFCIVGFWSYPQGVKKIILNNSTRLTLTDEVTALAVYSEVDLGGSIAAHHSSQDITIPIDPDAPQFTYFTSLSYTLKEGPLTFDAPGGTEVYLINSGTSPKTSSSHYRLDQESCYFEITPISQSEWREGLQPPNYTRSFTEVSHVVIHHSAGSNTATDYTKVVRDIYLYHTQTNGWSDIGYNYLVAQDGSIYAGRDPGSGVQDNVIGAHFCGKNSLTMGICLLGNYEEAEPTTATLQSLNSLLAFKCNKENLDPFGTYPHAFGDLPSILGHRDGCSTLCPGSNVYEQLDNIRNNTDILLDSCPEAPTGGPYRELSFTQDFYRIQTGNRILYQNTSEGYESYQWVLEGALPDTANWYSEGEAKYNLPGIYEVTLIGYYNDKSDTLYNHGIVTVLSKKPVIYPSVISRNEIIKVASDLAVRSLRLFSLGGEAYPVITINEETFQLPYLKSGIYLVRINTSEGYSVSKIRIN